MSYARPILRSSRYGDIFCFDFVLYFYYKLRHYRSSKMPIECMFCFICSKQCIIIISSCKRCGFLALPLRKLLLIILPLIFKEGGVTQPLIFCRVHNKFSWYRFKHRQIDRFLVPRYFYVFVCHFFQLKWTRTPTHS